MAGEMKWASGIALAASTAALSSAAAGQPEIPGSTRVAPVYVPVLSGAAETLRVSQRAPDLPIVTLREAIARAYLNNPNLLAERATLRATDERLPSARAGYGSTLDLQVAQGYQRDRTELLPGQSITRGGGATSALLILNQPIFTFGRLRSAENGALAEIGLQREALRLQESQTLLDVVNAFVSVERDTLAVGIAQDNLDTLGRQYRDSAERFRVREITSSDLQQIETRLELGRAQLLQTQGALGASRAQFLRTVGAPPAAQVQPPDTLPLGASTLDQAYEVAEENSPLIRGAQSRERVSRARINAARAEYGPMVSFRGTGSYGSVSPYSNELRASSLRGEAVLSQPLVDSGVRRAAVAAAAEANDADWRLIDQALRDARQAVASAWSQYNAAALSAANYARAEDAARRAYEGADVQEKAGARTTLDVLDLLRDLLNVRLSRINAEADAYAGRASLLAAMGRLEAPLLFPDLEPYDPARHLDKVRRKGDIPLLTPAISWLDGLATRSIDNERPIRDPSGVLRSEAPQFKAEPVLPLPQR
jgi:outer membrane protein